MNYLNEFELVFLNWLQGFKNPVLDVIAEVFSFICELGWLWILIAIVLLFFKKYRKNGIMLGCALALNLIICNLILKNAVARTRPYDMANAMYTQDMLGYFARRLTDFSFPSGHAAASFAASLSLAYANRKWGIAAYITTVMVSFSRMYLYVHYPTDILGGAITGTLSAVIVILVYKYVVKPRWDRHVELKNNRPS